MRKARAGTDPAAGGTAPPRAGAPRTPLLLAALLVAAIAAAWVWREPFLLSQLSRGPVPELERYAAEHPESRPAALALGKAYLRAGRPADAARQLGAWVARLPGDADARILLARALAQQNRGGEAYAHLQLVLTQ